MKRVLFTRATALALTVFMLLSGFAVCINAGEDTEIYENHDIVKQDFENCEIGATTFDNITIAIKTDKKESGPILVTEYGQDKDRVLKFTKNTGGTGIAHYTDLGSDNGIKAGSEFVLEMELMFETGIPNANLIEGRKVDSQNKPQFMAFLCANGTGFTVPGTGEMIQKIQQWEWYVVSIVVNDQLREYDIYIDGELKAENVPFASEDAKFSSANNYSCMRALNLTGHSSPIIAYVDDISLIYGNEPIYKGEEDIPQDETKEEEPEEEEEEEEEESEPPLFPAEDKKPSTAKESSALKESDSDKIYIAVLGALGVGAVAFLTVMKKKEEKAQ
jgi:hypothetical protein